MNLTAVKKRTEHFTAIALFILIITVYTLTLAPSIGFIDGGELATVAATLSIAHPTGYPLFTMLGRIFSIIPFSSEIVVRLNIMSAIFTAAAAVVFFYTILLLLRIERKNIPTPATLIAAAFGTLILAFSKTFWDQSAHVEVYSLHLLLSACTMLCFLRAVFSEETALPNHLKHWVLFAFVLGLCFTNHLTTILFAPGFLYLYFATRGFSKNSWKLIAILAVPFLMGLSVYLFLPLRAGTEPVLNWGNPVTLERIFWHVGGRQYRVWMFSSTAAAEKQFNYFIGNLPNEFFYGSLAAALLGVWRLLLHHRRILLFLLLLFAGCVLYSINYDIHDIDSYFLLAFIAIVFFAAFGAAEILGWWKSRTGRAAVIVVLTVLTLVQFYRNWNATDESGNYLVEDYTKNILMNLQPNAVVLSYQWDYFVAGAYYYQIVHNIRPDVVVIDKELLRRSWYFEQLRRNHPEIYDRSKKDIELFLTELYKFEHDQPYRYDVIESRYNTMIASFCHSNFDDRPLYVTAEIEAHLTTEYLRVPEGLLFRLCRDSAYHPVEFPRIEYRPVVSNDVYVKQIQNFYLMMLTERAKYEIYAGKKELAEPYIEKVNEIRKLSTALP
jgi:hypothetical protein